MAEKFTSTKDREDKIERLRQELRDIIARYEQDPACESDGVLTPYGIMQAAIAKYGADEQTLVAIEEMSELIKALIKYHRRPTTVGLLAIREEMADVSIMLDQMEMIYGHYADRRQEKLERLRKLVKA